MKRSTNHGRLTVGKQYVRAALKTLVSNLSFSLFYYKMMHSRHEPETMEGVEAEPEQAQ